jgi:aarF domain-containing kinase
VGMQQQPCPLSQRPEDSQHQHHAAQWKTYAPHVMGVQAREMAKSELQKAEDDRIGRHQAQPCAVGPVSEQTEGQRRPPEAQPSAQPGHTTVIPSTVSSALRASSSKRQETLHEEHAPRAVDTSATRFTQQTEVKQTENSKADSQHAKSPVPAVSAISNTARSSTESQNTKGEAAPRALAPPVSAIPKRKFRQRAVPTSRVSRALSFAGLGAGLAWGAAQDAITAAVSPAEPSGSSRPVLSERNAQRLANALCRMRGAALKIGQMLSIQDEDLLPPQVRRSSCSN